MLHCLLIASCLAAGPSTGDAWTLSDGVIRVTTVTAETFTATIAGSALVETASPLNDLRHGRRLERHGREALEALADGSSRRLRNLIAPGPGQDKLIESVRAELASVGEKVQFKPVGVVETATGHLRTVIRCSGVTGSSRIAFEWRHGYITMIEPDAAPPLELTFQIIGEDRARAYDFSSRILTELRWNSAGATLRRIPLLPDMPDAE